MGTIKLLLGLWKRNYPKYYIKNGIVDMYWVVSGPNEHVYYHTMNLDNGKHPMLSSRTEKTLDRGVSSGNMKSVTEKPF